jgi:hypothetical protein
MSTLKLEQQYETEIYVGAKGHLAIKQPDPIGDGDQLVLLTRDQATKLHATLGEWLKDDDMWTVEEDAVQ